MKINLYAEVKEEIREKILNSKALIYEYSLKEKNLNEAKVVIKDENIKLIFDYLNNCDFQTR